MQNIGELNALMVVLPYNIGGTTLINESKWLN